MGRGIAIRMTNKGNLKNWGNDPQTPLVHGTAVFWHKKGVLIIGPAGAGKSALALECLAMGAQLIADDRVFIKAQDGTLHLHRPAALKDMIECYGIGILHRDSIATAPLDLVVDLSKQAQGRLPAPLFTHILGHQVPCLAHTGQTNFAHALYVYISGNGFVTEGP